MQTKFTQNVRALPDYSQDILKSLRRIIRAVDLYSRRLVVEHGLSGPQLHCLKQLDSPEGMLTGRLAAELSLSPATVCGILDRLEARDLVSRTRQQTDKRCVVVRLTAKGRRTVRAAPPSLESGFLQKLNALPIRKQAEIDRVLESLVRLMSAEKLDAAPMLTSGAAVAGDTGANSSEGSRG